MRFLKVLAAVSAFGVTPVVSLAAGPFDGKWLVEDSSSIVEIAPCGTEICGRIVWLKDPVDPDTGKAFADKFNPDEALRVRPLLGLVILKITAGDGSAATVYDPSDGKSYSGTVAPTAQGGLKVKGCTFGGFFCDLEVWTRSP